MSNSALGILQVLGNGAAFIRRPEASYAPGRRDVYVGQKLIRRYDLRTGDEISGAVGKRPRNGKSAPLTKLELVNGKPPESLGHRPRFEQLGAQHPDEQLILECGRTYRGQPDFTNRVIDLLCPMGKGQRALIVSPPKAGKTTVLQAIAQGIATNYPDCKLFIVLVDERPEEVTEMEATGFGEVIASSFDHPPTRHVAVAEMSVERARRRVEMGEDVMIILDSITRLARAHNTVDEGSGRTLSGGLDATSMEKPKRFLGSARKISEAKGGGSLSIIATALVDTGSKMDQVIFEEFKGTGNSELVLSRELSDRRVYPAIDLVASATRREELLLSDDTLEASRTVRRELASATPIDAMNRLMGEMKNTKSNEEFVKLVLGRDR
ncbi:MAG: transcription termination factor Rho [Gemmatimonadetes bacterium]|nr:transcription termination factor Rho [Gemmatimonadota bacterium]MCH7715592.1 transcription termination factor Rho [Gemmatimonadota bacterium]